MVDNHDQNKAAPRDDSYARKLENDKKLAAWEAEQKERKEQERIAKSRAELEEHLHRRSKEWQETTGTTPPARVIESWQQQFMDERELERELERASRLAEAYAEYPDSFKR